MFGFFKRSSARAQRKYAPNPNANTRSFFSGEVDRVLNGWTTNSNSIDFYLGTELPSIRARSKEMVRRNPYGKRFITAIKSNIIGPVGVRVQAQSLFGKKLDTRANDAIEKALADWTKKENCDYCGKLSFLDMQNLAIANAGQDGQFIFRVYQGKAYGKYGFQIQALDPELLDVTKNHPTREGGQVRLGVEYNSNGRVVRYHFRKRDFVGNYSGSENYSLPAAAIIHGFIQEWPDQSQGIPWMHASLERSKHLEKYDESAIVAARAGAMKGGIVSGEGSDQYEGDEDGVGENAGYTIENIKTGSITDIGDRKFDAYDPAYPHQMYDSFVKQTLRGIASGIGVSYHTISNDLEGVNYSSIRAGVLEDREIFKGLQTWFIEQFISPVYYLWLRAALARQAITLGPEGRPLSRPFEEYEPAHFQARRWAWVDPQKDGAANQLAIDNLTKTRSQIIRDQGDDPETLWRERAREEDLLRELKLEPAKAEAPIKKETEEDDDEKPDAKT